MFCNFCFKKVLLFSYCINLLLHFTAIHIFNILLLLKHFYVTMVNGKKVIALEIDTNENYRICLGYINGQYIIKFVQFVYTPYSVRLTQWIH